MAITRAMHDGDRMGWLDGPVGAYGSFGWSQPPDGPPYPDGPVGPLRVALSLALGDGSKRLL